MKMLEARLGILKKKDKIREIKNGIIIETSINYLKNIKEK